MRSSTFFAGLALCGGLVSAFPNPNMFRRDDKAGFCLTDTDAASLTAGFVSLLTDYTLAEAQAILAPDFQDFSSSINFLIGADLTAATFPSIGAFEAGQSQQPPLFDFQVLSPTSWHTCTQVFFRWSTPVTPYAPGLPVFGINVMQIVKNNGVLQIQTNWSEFDSGVWVLDLNGTCSAGAS